MFTSDQGVRKMLFYDHSFFAASELKASVRSQIPSILLAHYHANKLLGKTFEMTSIHLASFSWNPTVLFDFSPPKNRSMDFLRSPVRWKSSYRASLIAP